MIINSISISSFPNIICIFALSKEYEYDRTKYLYCGYYIIKNRFH